MPSAEHKTTEAEIKEIWERLTNGEASIKSAHHRIDNLQEVSKNIKELAVSIAQIAVETKALREDHEKSIGRIEVLEDKPLKRWDTVATAFLTAIGSGVAGYLIATLLKG